MEELHAAIAAHLRSQRGQRAETGARDERTLAIWYARSGVPRCKICGAAVDDDDQGLYNLDDMRRLRECHLHYVPF